jgi:hypothetical protein
LKDKNVNIIDQVKISRLIYQDLLLNNKHGEINSGGIIGVKSV